MEVRQEVADADLEIRFAVEQLIGNVALVRLLVGTTIRQTEHAIACKSPLIQFKKGLSGFSIVLLFIYCFTSNLLFWQKSFRITTKQKAKTVAPHV